MQKDCKNASLIVGDLRPPVETPEPYFQEYMSKLFKIYFYYYSRINTECQRKFLLLKRRHPKIISENINKQVEKSLNGGCL